MRIISLILVWAFVLPDLAISAPISPDRSALAPPLAMNPPCKMVKLPDGRWDVITSNEAGIDWIRETFESIGDSNLHEEFRKKWEFVHISFLIAQALKLQISKYTLIDLLVRATRTIPTQGMGFQGMDAINDNGKIIAFSLPIISGDGSKLRYNLVYSLEKSENAEIIIRLDDETSVYVNVESEQDIEKKVIDLSQLSREEVERIERLGIAFRSMYHNLSFFDPMNDMQIIGARLDLLRNSEPIYPKQKAYISVPDKASLASIRSDLFDLFDVLKIVCSGGEPALASKRGTLTAQKGEEYIKELTDVLSGLWVQKEKLDEIRGRFISALGGNKPRGQEQQILEDFDSTILVIDNLMEKIKSRIDFSAGTPSQNKAPLEEILDRACKNIEHLRIDDGGLSSKRITGDRLALAGVVRNVLKNAEHFAELKNSKDADVSLTVSEERDFIKIDISDNGPGILPELLELDPVMNRPKLFNLNVSRRKEGTGLGLTETWYTVKDHGGTVEVLSEPGKGATFTIRLPGEPSLIDFASFTPQGIDDLYAKEALDMFKRRISEVIQIPARKRDFNNAIKAVEDALVEFGEAVGPAAFMREVSSNEAVSRAAREVNEKMGKEIIGLYMNEELYRAIVEYAENNEIEGLKGEDRQLFDGILRLFELNGMKIEKDKKVGLKTVKERRVELKESFEENLKKNKPYLVVTCEELDGVVLEDVEGLGPDPEEKDKLRLPVNFKTYDIIMTQANREALRQRFQYAMEDQAHDLNFPVFQEINDGRQKEAALLGYSSYAEEVLDDNMAEGPETVFAFLEKYKNLLKEKCKKELDELLRLKQMDDPEATRLNSWDIPYYINKQKEEILGRDLESLREYFSIDTVTKGTLDFFENLFNLKFTEVKGPVWHDDVRIIQVTDKATGSLIGHMYLDLYYRDEKGGREAYANPLISGRELGGGKRQHPVTVMVTNFKKNLTHQDAQVFLHEFGHLMHHMLGKSRYKRFFGTSVARDFSEVPSMWAQNLVWQKEFLRKITGGKMPDELMDKLITTRKVAVAYEEMRVVARSLIDMECHAGKIKPSLDMIQEIFKECGIELSEGVPYLREGRIGHFVGGYAAGYYSYLWSHVYAQDIFSTFTRNGVMLSGDELVKRGIALREGLLSRGSSIPEIDQLKNVLGREASDEAYLRYLGIDPKKSSLIDFPLFTPDRMKELYDEAKNKHQEAIRAIIRKKRTFTNIVKALENARQEFNRMIGPIDTLARVSPDRSVRVRANKIIRASGIYFVAIGMDEEIFKAVKEYAESKEAKTLIGEDKKLLEDILDDFKQNGMGLEEGKKLELRKVKLEYMKKAEVFEQNLQEAEEELIVTEEELEGLPREYIDKLSAKDGGRRSLRIDYTTYEMVMENAKSEILRRRYEEAFQALAIGKNLPLFEEMIELRKRMAQLLGYSSYTEYAFKDRMAGTPDAVFAFLEEMRGPLLEKNKKIMERLLKLKRKDNPQAVKIYSWDVKYYFNQLKKEYFNPEDIPKYFPAHTVVNNALKIFEEFLGLEFIELKDAPKWHESVRVFGVKDKATGHSIGYFHLDLFKRPGKYQYKAMATSIIEGRRLPDGTYQKPVAAIVANLPENFPHWDVEVFFHEFGHLMHNILTQAKYSRFSGTNVKIDFVEVMSDLFQELAWQPEILERLSEGKLPKETIEKMIEFRKLTTPNHALGTIARSIFDMRCHTEEVKDIEGLIRECFVECGIYLSENKHYFNSAATSHIVSGYAAGYYSYPWAERYMRDILSRFQKEGIGNPAVWRDLINKILIWGSSKPEIDQIEDFLGREPNDEAFLRFLGIAPPEIKRLIEEFRIFFNSGHNINVITEDFTPEEQQRIINDINALGDYGSTFTEHAESILELIIPRTRLNFPDIRFAAVTAMGKIINQKDVLRALKGKEICTRVLNVLEVVANRGKNIIFQDATYKAARMWAGIQWESATRAIQGIEKEEAEQISGVRFTDEIKMIQASQEKAISFIAVGTDWMKGYRKENALEYNVLNPYVSAIKKYCEKHDIQFIVGDDSAIAGSVSGIKDKDRNSRGIVLAGETAIGNIEAHLKEMNLENDKNLFLASVNGENVGVNNYIRLVEMLRVMISVFRSGPITAKDIEAIQKEHPQLGASLINGRLIFIPHAEPVNYEDINIKALYTAQVSA